MSVLSVAQPTIFQADSDYYRRYAPDTDLDFPSNLKANTGYPVRPDTGSIYRILPDSNPNEKRFYS
jgi:hypothetical protein